VGQAELDREVAAGRQVAAEPERAGELAGRQLLERCELLGRRVRADRLDVVVRVRRQDPLLILAGGGRGRARDVAIGARARDVRRQPDRDFNDVVELEQRDAARFGTIAIVGRRGCRVGLGATPRLGDRRDRRDGREDGGDQRDERGEAVHGRWQEQSPCHA
jgi:hypothetical protein